jgi:predicted ribosome quality control (RQC) complex YloA/Tae2 family protein
MNDYILTTIVDELKTELIDQTVGKLYQLNPSTLVFDFRLNNGRFLLVSADSVMPRIYLIRRTLKELDKLSAQPSQFILQSRKYLRGSVVKSIEKVEEERIVKFELKAFDELDREQRLFLIAQLTGRSSNIYLLNEDEQIIVSLRPVDFSRYELPPKQSVESKTIKPAPFDRGLFETLSDAADNYYETKVHERAFKSRTEELLRKYRKERDRVSALISNLEDDLRVHGDPEENRKLADNLLANIATATREGNRVKIRDFYSEDAPVVEVLIEEETIQEAAEKLFQKYTKGKRAVAEVGKRLSNLRLLTEELDAKIEKVNKAIELKEPQLIEEFLEPEKPARRTEKEIKIQGARGYKSTDGFEILVGKGARGNDHITFKIARPNDLWLHTADYPGSHVVIRNNTKKEIPQRTIIEAAQLAAYFSRAKDDSKVSVHYTERKFITKPKGAAPGLVRLSRFRTMVVEPTVKLEQKF